MPQIYLIGTNHRDLKGSERLSRALETIRPDNIVGEASKEFATTILTTHYRWSRMPKETLKEEHAFQLGIKAAEITDVGLAAFQHTFAYEVPVCFAYALSTGARISWPCLTPQQEIENARAAASKTGVTRVLDEYQDSTRYAEMLKATPEWLEEHQRRVEESYVTRRPFEENLEYWNSVFDPSEDLMAEEVRRSDGKIILPVGSDHILSCRCDLYRKLEDLRPKRFTLSDFDKPMVDAEGLPLVAYD